MLDECTGPELDSLLAKPGITRRDMLVTSLAVGFAAAVRPVRADTAITTDTGALTAGEVKIPVADGEIPGYRAMPASGGPFPVVLVVQEIFGVHEHIKDVCRRFAKAGYLAVASELYARQGDVSKMTDYKEVVAQVVSKVPDAQVMSDLDAAVAWAGRSGSGDVKRVGITGFCWGGRIVWLYAAHSPDLKAGVAWYGRLVGEATELRPKKIRQNDEVEINADKGVIRNLTTKEGYRSNPIPPFMQELIDAGGLIAWTKRKLNDTSGN